MEPATAALNAIKTSGDLTLQYGIQVVLCFVMIIMFALILRFVLKFMDKLVNDTLNNQTKALIALTDSNNVAHSNQLLMFERISKDIKDGFDSMRQGNIFQRDEHKDLKAAEMDTRQILLEKINDVGEKLECKAKL